MTKREFLRQHREYISDLVATHYGENCRPTNDSERWDWIMNDEGLYQFARSMRVSV